MDSEPKKVLISCAKDTCSAFGGELFKSLKNCGYPTKVVSDDHQAALTTEEIRRFRIFIIVLSEHYATCQFRLDRLVEIVDKVSKTKRQRVFPVFFDVEPYDVKNQKRSFEIAFDVHKNYVNADRLKKWREALTRVGLLDGWDFKRSGNTYAYDLVKEIIEAVSEIVPCTVGLHSRVEAVNGHLKFESDAGVRIVGIYGEAGIGKSTVAREVDHSNSFENFDSHCFLDRVGECLKTRGLVGLVKGLLLKIGGNDIEFKSVNEAMSILKQQVEEKRLFLVLEDILDKYQLHDIIEVTNCFGSNSKVIITAVENSFQEYPQIKSYKVERLEVPEALDLLSLKVFNSKQILVQYCDILQRAETIASGVPLIIEVIGSHLAGKSEPSCTSILDQYENIEDDKKLGILKMSFHDLNIEQRENLISIAIALDKQEIWKVKGLCANLKDDIKVFLGKSLIKIEHDLVTMHDLTRNMVIG